MLKISELMAELTQEASIFRCDLSDSGIIRLATPLWFPTNEMIDVFVQHVGNEYVVSDRCDAVLYLADMHVEIDPEYLRQVCEGLDLSFDSESFKIYTTARNSKEIITAVFKVAQAIYAIVCQAYYHSPSIALVKTNLPELRSIIDWHYSMIEAHQANLDGLRKSGKTGRQHVEEHRQRIRELDHLLNKTWPK